MPAPRWTKKSADRIGQIYANRFSGVQVPMMSTPEIFANGKMAFLAGRDEEGIYEAMAVIVNKVRTN